MTKKLIALIGLSLLFSPQSNAARNTRRASSNTRSASQNVRVTGRTVNINANVSDTTYTETDYSKIAPATDPIAKRKCTELVVEALTEYCGTDEENKECNNTTEGSNESCGTVKKCKNATEAYAKIKIEDNPNGPNEIYCANFIEEAVNNLWDSFDTYKATNEKNCNIALARSLAAEECYRYALTQKNVRFSINSFETFKEEELSMCNKAAVVKIYKTISNGDTITEDEAGDNIASYFSKVGASGWTNLAVYTRLLDANVDLTTTEFPRDLILLVNSLKSQGNMMCGQDHYTELVDANIQLIDKTGSWEKQIKEKGAIAGTADYIADTTESIVNLRTLLSNTIKSDKAEKTAQNAEKATEKLAEIDNDITIITANISRLSDENKNKKDTDNNEDLSLSEHLNKISDLRNNLPEQTANDYSDKIKELEKEIKDTKTKFKKVKGNEIDYNINYRNS